MAQDLSKRLVFSKASEVGPDELVHESAAELYKLHGKSAPAIIWCQSPYQMATLPSLLIGLFFSDAWQIVSGVLAERDFDEQWSHDFEESWQALWAHGGQQLLRGMKQTSRIAEQYGELEAALCQRSKEELKFWFQSGKLQDFESQLPKEIIYRHFWAMRLWHLNFVRDRLRKLNADLSGIFQSLRHGAPLQWQEFQSSYEHINRVYAGAEQSMRSLINRMGAEPAYQLNHCVYLPLSLPSVTNAHVWMEEISAEAFSDYKAEILCWTKLSQSCSAVLCLDKVIFACRKAQNFELDPHGRLHAPNKAALVYEDGFKEYAWHGVIVDERIIENPDSITIEEIESTRNAEIRRVLIERYGEIRYLKDSGAEKIHEDDCGILYRKEIPGDEALLMVKVVNSSPEPDGSFKDYFLRVPPETRSAKQAVAWTFGLSEEEYQPIIES
ncbi:MAG: hypothetical protein K2X27_06915 [Candidatus Obscuribacterales bacterium]|nr:hypothetical protein [Candidatus Obscuribacterales bacterium]